METINSKVMKLAHANYKTAVKENKQLIQSYENDTKLPAFIKERDLKELRSQVIEFRTYLIEAWQTIKMSYTSQRDQRKAAKETKKQQAAKAAAQAALKGQTDITNDTARIEKIARNINAFNTYYDYIDTNNGQWAFFNDLRGKIGAVLFKLNQQSKEAVKALCQPQQALYFGL